MALVFHSGGTPGGEAGSTWPGMIAL